MRELEKCNFDYVWDDDTVIGDLHIKCVCGENIFYDAVDIGETIVCEKCKSKYFITKKIKIYYQEEIK